VLIEPIMKVEVVTKLVIARKRPIFAAGFQCVSFRIETDHSFVAWPRLFGKD
jgi:hypothetical protein